MLPHATSFTVTTGLLIAGACFVVYLRLRNELESNIPLIFYALILVYTNAFEGLIPAGVIFGGLTLALFLRFEFMNGALTFIIRSAELLALGVVIYDCTGVIMRS